MDDQGALDEVRREIKTFGQNIAGLKESMERDLAEVRRIANEAKSTMNDPILKAHIDRLTTAVAEKDAALETLSKDLTKRLDDIERKGNRPRIGAETDDEVKSARDFLRNAGLLRGEIKVGTDAGDGPDIASFHAYRKAFPLYLRRDDKSLQGADIKAMTVGSDPDGGYFVTPTVGNIVNGVIFETSPIRSLATVETISSDALEFPRDDDEASAGWVGEREDRPETATPKGGMQRIAAHEMYAEPKISQKLLEDASFDVEAWLGRKVGDKFGRVEATAFVSGDGRKKPRGFTTYASGTYSAGSTGKIEQVSAGTGGQVGFDDLINLLTSLKDYYLSGAVWLMQRATVGKVMLLKDGDGHYLWQPNTQAGKPSVLLGYDVRQAADMDAVGASKLPIAFGNFKMGYTIVDRVGISTLRDPYTAKPFVLFYSRKRLGGDVVNFEAIKLLAT